MIQYSDDLRERIIFFFENHPDYTQQEIADEFGASRSFIERSHLKTPTEYNIWYSAGLPATG